MNHLTESRKWLMILLMLCVCLMLLMVGCKEGAKNLGDMTPTERAAYMLSTYNSQYDDYMAVTGYTKGADDVWIKTSEPDLSSDEIKILQKKKEILIKVKPLIRTYLLLTEGGVTPTVENEQQILTLLLELSRL
jgi:hypothetical protein